MSRKNSVATFLIYGLAIVGLIVVAPGILAMSAGLFGLVIQLLAWMFAGVIAGRIMRGEGYGPLADIGLGLIGGIVGSWLFGLIGMGGMANGGLIASLIVGVVGAIVFIQIVRLFDRDFGK